MKIDCVENVSNNENKKANAVNSRNIRVHFTRIMINGHNEIIIKRFYEHIPCKTHSDALGAREYDNNIVVSIISWIQTTVGFYFFEISQLRDGKKEKNGVVTSRESSAVSQSMRVPRTIIDYRTTWYRTAEEEMRSSTYVRGRIVPAGALHHSPLTRVLIFSKICKHDVRWPLSRDDPVRQSAVCIII